MTLSLGIAPLTADTPKRQARTAAGQPGLFSLINGTRLADVRAGAAGGPAALLPQAGGCSGRRRGLFAQHGFPRQGGQYAGEAGGAFALCDRSSAAKADPLVFHGVDVVRFLLSSLASFGVDYAVFTLLYLFVSKSVTLCTVGARIISSFFNYMINGKWSSSRKAGGLGRCFVIMRW